MPFIVTTSSKPSAGSYEERTGTTVQRFRGYAPSQRAHATPVHRPNGHARSHKVIMSRTSNSIPAPWARSENWRGRPEGACRRHIRHVAA